MSTSSKLPYTGTQRKLVIAFDVGTTFSGISYAILDPGEVPEICGVTQFPAQKSVGADCKIPTILYYDTKGNMRAAGAEACDDGIADEVEDQGWVKAEWFKLHLRPKTKGNAYVTDSIYPLPPGKTVVDLFSDFLRYLHKCTRSYIEERHPKGADLWKSLEPTAEYVLTHPNGWEGGQQNQMRRAAINAGLITDDAQGRGRLSFLTEGEASLHFCVHSGLTAEANKSGKGVLIIDAGGGTIDISAYKQAQGGGYEEIATPQCHIQGSVMVTTRMSAFLKSVVSFAFRNLRINLIFRHAAYLEGSKYSNAVQHITKCFDQSTKLVFRNNEDWQYIKFGMPNDRESRLNIRHGQLKLPGSDVAACFDPAIECIIKSIEEQKKTASSDIVSIFLVGGFAANDWLFKQIKNKYSAEGIDVSRPDRLVNKAVANGAISFYLDHLVSARIAKFHYGTPACVAFRPNDPDHEVRSKDVFVGVSGRKWIKGLFSCILAKDTKVKESEQFRSHFFQEATSQYALGTIVAPITCYRGKIEKPKWMDEDSSMYHTLCYVEADTSVICKSLKPQLMPNKKTPLPYYEIKFDIVLSFGLTEFKAHIAWMEDGMERTSPAEFVYDTNAVIPHAMED
ncbi:hypothetical protein CVT24_003479 [Panaeolus cyanescens]|uniref:Uncharacterized protein n=1 Tax=Panaeolus cyanescens TaxID=181874 RepID=A0A409Y7I1_9AGAR|nr:hypothetical protein CVT24_003479 [Panaeolus cyanescens]